jgi:hypothetical protein
MPFLLGVAVELTDSTEHRSGTASLRTGFLLSVETLVHQGEGRFAGISDTGYRDDIDAVEVMGIPFRHHRRVGAVSGEECAGCGFDTVVLPGNKDARVAICGLFERVSQRIRVRDADAHIDGQAK